MNALPLRSDDSTPTLVFRTPRKHLALVPPQPQPQPLPLPPPDETQPAHRLRRENQAYRRITLTLVIALAFATGGAAAFAAQLVSLRPTAVERPPRVAQTRAATLRLLDGAAAKAESHDRDSVPLPRVSTTPRVRTAKAGRPAPAPLKGETAPEESSPSSPDARDILGKGITVD